VSKGFFARAKGIVGRFHLQGNQDLGHPNSAQENWSSSAGDRKKSAGEGGQGVTLSYDVWRTVEETGQESNVK